MAAPLSQINMRSVSLDPVQSRYAEEKEDLEEALAQKFKQISDKKLFKVTVCTSNQIPEFQRLT